jgi:Leu/Phe-tRNA-protein transferase
MKVDIATVVESCEKGREKVRNWILESFREITAEASLSTHAHVADVADKHNKYCCKSVDKDL